METDLKALLKILYFQFEIHLMAAVRPLSVLIMDKLFDSPRRRGCAPDRNNISCKNYIPTS